MIMGTHVSSNDKLQLREHEQIVHKKTIWRLWADTVVVMYARMSNGQQVITIDPTPRNRSLEQQQKLSKSLESEIKDCYVLILRAAYDRDHRLDISQDGWNSYAQALRSLRGFKAEVIDYTMIPGNCYCAQDHFECELTQQGLSWWSAIDGFQKHVMTIRK